VRIVSTRLLLLSIPVLLVLTTNGRPAEPEWKVGLAEVKITPERPVSLAGYASRNHPFEKVTTDLYAKAISLEDRDGHVAVIVTTDLIGLTAVIAEPICERLATKTGVKREQILLSSSHIHTGPSLSLNPKDREGKATSDEAQRTVEYTRWLQDRLVEVVERALEKREPARLSWSSGVANFVMNRRESTPGGVILGVNPRGPADRTVPVLRIDGSDGKPRGVLFGAATHNTTLTDKCYEVCGDYAGFAQTYVQERYPGVQALFMLGLAGDSNPYPRGTMDLAREHGTALGKEVCRVLETKLQPVRGPLKIAFGQADLPLQAPPPREELEKQAARKGPIQSWVAQQMLATLDRGEKLPTGYRCPIAIWQFADDLTLVALSGEVVVDYVMLLEKALGPNRLWLAAYCNDVFGYLPSARVLSEGGYETRGLYTGGIGVFSPQAQDVLVEGVRKLAEQAGRRLPETKNRESKSEDGRSQFATASLFSARIERRSFNADSSELGQLEVHGKDLVYGGKPIRLRGVAVGDPVTGRQGRPTSDYEFLAKDWKANVVRIGIHPRIWKSQAHDKVLTRLAEDVDAALKNKMFVIIDWHVIGWPNGYYEIPEWGGEKDTYDSDFKLAKDFWGNVAQRYGKDGRVMFEFWNEPVFQKQDWAPAVGQKWAAFKPYMHELLDIVRRHGDNVVIVSSNRWSYWLKGVRNDLLKGKNIAYAWHVYAGHSKNNPKAWTEALDELQTVAPVLVTEWGFQQGAKAHFRGGPEEFGKPFVRDFLEGKELHSTAWCWHPTWGPPMLKNDWRTPNQFGEFVRDYLREHNK
jgi:neutral ceramidase